jgi:ABC-type Fe3+-hydroxamate transport system substrate-binding protein
MQAAGKSVERVATPRHYVFGGKAGRYYPDFIVDGQVIEIKGWKTPQWEAKLEQNPDVVVLGYDEIKPMIEHAQFLYGEDFTAAYE